MRQFFYAMARHGVMLKALLVLAVIVAIVIAVGTSETVVAMPDAWGP